MDTTTFFGLAWILIAIQFTGLSHEQSSTYYLTRHQRYYPRETINQANIELPNDNFGLQAESGSATRQWYSFIENLDLHNMAVEYILELAESVIEGRASKESTNYFNILNVLESLADKTICNNSTSNYNFIYYGTVALTLIEDKISAKKKATEFYKRIQHTQSKIFRIKSIIENTNATHKCLLLPLSECNRIIYNIIIQSDRDVLIAEAQTLLNLADLAHLYFWTYHTEFYEAANKNNVFWHLMKTRSHIRPLVQAIVSVRLQTNTEVPNC